MPGRSSGTRPSVDVGGLEVEPRADADGVKLAVLDGTLNDGGGLPDPGGGVGDG